MKFPVSVFSGAGVLVVMLLSGCGQDKTPGSLPRSDGESIDVPQPDDGGVVALTVPQPDGSAVPVPPTCQIPTSASAPYPVKFRFRNRASVAVYRYLGCTSEVEIASCASAYSDQLASRVSCPCDCVSGICPTCGACLNEGAALAPGAIFEQEWDGLVPVTGTGPSGGRACNHWKAVPAGRYRVRLPVYASAADAMAHGPTLAVASADFELPTAAPGGVFEIDIAP